MTWQFILAAFVKPYLPQIEASQASIKAVVLTKETAALDNATNFIVANLPHNDVWQRMARGHIEDFIRQFVVNVKASSPAAFDYAWASWMSDLKTWVAAQG